jgi:hypothetical protein
MDVKADIKETVYENSIWINLALYPVVGACEHWLIFKDSALLTYLRKYTNT